MLALKTVMVKSVGLKSVCKYILSYGYITKNWLKTR